MAEKYDTDRLEDLAFNVAGDGIRIFNNTRHLQKKTLRVFVGEYVRESKFLKGVLREMGGQNVHQVIVGKAIDDAVNNYYEKRRDEPEDKYPWIISIKRLTAKRKERSERNAKRNTNG